MIDIIFAKSRQVHEVPECLYDFRATQEDSKSYDSILSDDSVFKIFGFFIGSLKKLAQTSVVGRDVLVAGDYSLSEESLEVPNEVSFLVHDLLGLVLRALYFLLRIAPF